MRSISRRLARYRSEDSVRGDLARATREAYSSIERSRRKHGMYSYQQWRVDWHVAKTVISAGYRRGKAS